MRENTEYRKILVTDDDVEDVDLIRRALNKTEFGGELVHAGNGEELMSLLSSYSERDQSEMPDLILLDLNMPVLNGRETLSRLKRHAGFKKIPVVVFSSSSASEDIGVAYELGANSYVAKPVSISLLNETIQKIVSFWLRCAQIPR